MPAPMEFGLVFDGSCMHVTNAKGDTVELTSVRYNVSLGALELRGSLDIDKGPQIVESVGASPLRFRVSHPAGRAYGCTVHFESARLAFPFECTMVPPALVDGREADTIIQEVVLLRGVRVEME